MTNRCQRWRNWGRELDVAARAVQSIPAAVERYCIVVHIVTLLLCCSFEICLLEKWGAVTLSVLFLTIACESTMTYRH